DVERIGELRPDDTEFLEVVLLPLAQVIETARKGGLAQAMHVATLFLALAQLDPSWFRHLTGLPQP
ncbi:MAG: hypothetical protein ACM30E_01255, partial [Nitrososphaerales archaeon]